MATANTVQVSTPVRVARMTQKTKSGYGIWILRVLVILLCIITFFPTFYVLVVSFRPGESAFINTIIPSRFTTANYEAVLGPGSNFPLWVRNSLFYGITAAVISLTIATLAGFAFSRFRFPGRNYGILSLLVLQMLPTSASLVAFYYAFLWIKNNTGALGDIIGLGTPGSVVILMGFPTGALAVWLMKNYMDSVPFELDEAAFMDGATHWQTFTRVVFPLIQPILIAQFILNFIGVYNEYVVTSLFLSKPEFYPLGVGVRFYLQSFSQDWPKFCAAAVMGSVPIMIIFLLAQRFLVEGLTQGALKG